MNALGLAAAFFGGALVAVAVVLCIALIAANKITKGDW